MIKYLEIAQRVLLVVIILSLFGWATSAQYKADKRKKIIAEKKELITQLSAANAQFMSSLVRQSQSVSFYVAQGKASIAYAEKAKKSAQATVQLQDQLIKDLLDQLPTDDPEIIRVRLINEARR